LQSSTKEEEVMATIREMPNRSTKFERIGAHTHVKGLGPDENLWAVKIKDALVGQEKAREATEYLEKYEEEFMRYKISKNRHFCDYPASLFCGS